MQTIERIRSPTPGAQTSAHRQQLQKHQRSSATLPHSISSSPTNGFASANNGGANNNVSSKISSSTCAGCKGQILDGQTLVIALDLHWHVHCFRCAQCNGALHGEYVAKDNQAYCEADYQKLFGIACAYCKRYITGKVLQAGETHHFHPSCARCSKCAHPFVPGEEMYLQGEVTWHPRCGPPFTQTESSLIETDDDWSQCWRSSPACAASEPVGDLSRIYTISYLNSDPNQAYPRRRLEPNAPKSAQFSRPTSSNRLAANSADAGGDRSRCLSRSQQQQVHSSSSSSTVGARERSTVPGGMSIILGGMRSGSGASRARSPSMNSDEPISMAAYPSGQKPAPNSLAKIERDDFPAPPFAYLERHQQANQERVSRPRLREITLNSQQQQQQQRRRRRRQDSDNLDDSLSSTCELDAQLSKDEEELSKCANGIGKIFLQALKEREKLRAWKRANLDPRNASRTPSATRELASRLRYDNPTNASPSRDLNRPRSWQDDELLLLLQQQQLSGTGHHSPVPRTRSSLGRQGGVGGVGGGSVLQSEFGAIRLPNFMRSSGSVRSLASAAAQLSRSMPNVTNLHHLHLEGPPKLYPYHLLATANYRLPPGVDRCHLERHLSNEEFQYIFHCDRLDFYRLPEWKRNELKRRARLF